MEIRHIADRSDVRGLIRAHALAWRAAYEEFLPPAVLERYSIDPTPAEVDRWHDRLSENHEGVLVAVDEGTVLGFADFRWGDAETKPFVGENEAGVKAIYVDPDHWGEGIGSALLTRGISLLPPSVDTLRLEAFAENDLGARFYERRGFEVTGREDHEIAGESYAMKIYSRNV